MKKLTIAQRVKKGMTFLDEKLGPLWVKKIDLVRLDVSDSKSCPLGQTDGDYYEHTARLGLEKFGKEVRDLGFLYYDNYDNSENNEGNESNQMLLLTRAWRLAIARRLNEIQK